MSDLEKIAEDRSSMIAVNFIDAVNNAGGKSALEAKDFQAILAMLVTLVEAAILRKLEAESDPDSA